MACIKYIYNITSRRFLISASCPASIRSAETHAMPNTGPFDALMIVGRSGLNASAASTTSGFAHSSRLFAFRSAWLTGPASS